MKEQKAKKQQKMSQKRNNRQNTTKIVKLVLVLMYQKVQASVREVTRKGLQPIVSANNVGLRNSPEIYTLGKDRNNIPYVIPKDIGAASGIFFWPSTLSGKTWVPVYDIN